MSRWIHYSSSLFQKEVNSLQVDYYDFLLLISHVMNSFCLPVLAGCQCHLLTAVVSQCFGFAESLGCPEGSDWQYNNWENVETVNFLNSASLQESTSLHKENLMQVTPSSDSSHAISASVSCYQNQTTMTSWLHSVICWCTRHKQIQHMVKGHAGIK